jgi:hypothetical protein
MDDEIDQLRKKIKREFDDNIGTDEDSDIPISERKVKYKKVKMI